MPEPNGNGGWKTWLLGIIAGLVLLGIVGSIVLNREFAERLGKHDSEIMSLRERLIERTGNRFTREDADREFRARDQARERLERRIDKLEKHP